MKRKSQDETSEHAPNNKNIKRPKRQCAIKANKLISSQAFIPRLVGDDLPELDLSVIDRILRIGAVKSSSESDEENQESDDEEVLSDYQSGDDREPVVEMEEKIEEELAIINERKQVKSQNIINLIRKTKFKQHQKEIEKEKQEREEIEEIREKQDEILQNLKDEMEQINQDDLILLQLVKNMEREYEEKIKILTEKCFLLELRCNQLLNEKREKEDEEFIELDPICEFGGLSPPSPPTLEKSLQTPMIELTPPSPPTPVSTEELTVQLKETLESNPVIELTPPSPPTPVSTEENIKEISLSQETQICEKENESIDEAVTPQKRRVGLILEDPMEMHFNSSPSLSDTSSEIDFTWLFEQQLMPPPSTPSSQRSPSLSTSTDSSDYSGGSRRSSRRGEKRQKIESILNRLRSEMNVSILLPNLIINEYVNSEIERSESLEKTPPRNGSVVKRSSLSSEHIYTDRKLKLKDKSYVRTNYSYRGIELPENLIFFCK